MGQELGNVALNLNTKAPRRVGQTRNARFSSIHGDKGSQNKASSQNKIEFRKPIEIAVDAPPQSSSGSEAGSAIHELGNASSELSEPESVSSRKRRQRQNSLRPSKRKNTPTHEDGSHSTEENPMKSQISLTTFTRSSRNDTCKLKPSAFDRESSDEPFKDYRPLSQPTRIYDRSRKYVPNLHAPQKSEKERKAPSSAPSRQGIGFICPATSALDALNQRKVDEKATDSSTYKEPPVVDIVSPDSKKPQRSTRNRQGSGQPPTPKQSSKRSKAEDAFKVPTPNPLQPTFRDPGRFPALPKNCPSEAAEIAKIRLKTLGVDITAQSLDVPSSLPSIESNIPDDASETSSLSTAPSSAHVDADGRLLDLHNSPTPASYVETDESSKPLTDICPACKLPVPKDLFTTFQHEHDLTVSGGRIPWKHQKLFCKTHKTQTARDKWVERGYPNIDWDYLPRRIEQHETLVEGILVGKKQSHYRKVLEEKLQSGKRMTFGRSLASSDETGDSQTGYYGSRGAKMMMEYLAKAFSVLLRNLNTSDKLISAGGGVSAYVQAVLVPELATALIKEDLGVDEKRAKEIIKESAELGELVNEEEGDVVDEEEVERKRLQDEEERRQEEARRRDEERRKQHNGGH